jgi:excisionase family DNA binding protein
MTKEEVTMPRTKKTPVADSQFAPAAQPGLNGPTNEVLSLSEAAAYLRLPIPEVLRLVAEQDLPARCAGREWRFLKCAVQAWLGTPLLKEQKQEIWAAAGTLKDDPYLEEMLTEIDRMRGRPTTQED